MILQNCKSIAQLSEKNNRKYDKQLIVISILFDPQKKTYNGDMIDWRIEYHLIFYFHMNSEK